MPNTPAGHRAFRRTAAAVGAAALMALGAAAPAAADGDSPPGLVLGDLGPFEGVRPGSTFEVPATFTNAGSEALDTVYLSYEVTRGLSRTEVPSNCLRYEIPSYDEAPELERVVCEFDQRIEPGTVYAPARTWTLKAGENALWDRLRVVVATEPSDPGDSGAEPVRGTDPAVALVEKPDATPATSGGRGDYDVAELEVKAENTADFQVTGGRLTGAVGDVVDLKATFTNAGPGWVLRPLGRSVTEVLVDLPEGTTVTKGNGYCDKVSARRYSCGTAQSWVDEKGGETYAFKVRIEQEGGGRRGKRGARGPGPAVRQGDLQRQGRHHRRRDRHGSGLGRYGLGHRRFRDPVGRGHLGHRHLRRLRFRLRDGRVGLRDRRFRRGHGRLHPLHGRHRRPGEHRRGERAAARGRGGRGGRAGRRYGAAGPSSRVPPVTPAPLLGRRPTGQRIPSAPCRPFGFSGAGALIRCLESGHTTA
ncbi:hypothetical protein [Streptomyces sp. ACT015]|uniref:hypothetical protein n=1 Tax=Streptomyces sp. ACT015 TaxID=3134807 RepID=UPI003D17A520